MDKTVGLIAAVFLLFTLSLVEGTPLRGASEIVEADAVHAPNGESLRFFALGDWGGQGLPILSYRTPGQLAVAAQMAKMASHFDPHMILGLGDNFYWTGVKDVNDIRFKKTFEEVYSYDSLKNLPWYHVAGNHDHYGNVSAEIEYSKLSPRWNFPDYFYTKSFDIPSSNGESVGKVAIVFIDTILLNEESQQGGEEHWDWVERSLKEATGDWKLVVGHFPVWSMAEHGPTASLVQNLKPMLEKYGVDAYLCGHDHNLQHINDGSNVNYYISGSGTTAQFSDKHKDIVPDGASKFFWPSKSMINFVKGGYMTGEISKSQMEIVFYNGLGQEEYRHSVSKPVIAQSD